MQNTGTHTSIKQAPEHLSVAQGYRRVPQPTHEIDSEKLTKDNFITPEEKNFLDLAADIISNYILKSR